jgi:hypothetical protein
LLANVRRAFTRDPGSTLPKEKPALARTSWRSRGAGLLALVFAFIAKIVQVSATKKSQLRGPILRIEIQLLD